MNLRALEAFCATYEEASFTRAARRLGLAQPTISSHIAALEKELGAAMFDRVGREIQPTRAARLLYRHARRLLDLSREMTAELDRFLHGLHGHLQVGASTIPGEYWLPARLGRFHALYPEIEITLEIHDTREVTERVRDGRLELGVVGARIEDGGLAFRELGLAIGLAASERLEESMGATLRSYVPLGEAIESFWLDPEHRQTPTWSEHRDINEVMLATRLAPLGYLELASA